MLVKFNVFFCRYIADLSRMQERSSGGKIKSNKDWIMNPERYKGSEAYFFLEYPLIFGDMEI